LLHRIANFGVAGLRSCGCPRCRAGGASAQCLLQRTPTSSAPGLRSTIMAAMLQRHTTVLSRLSTQRRQNVFF
jgi:hypothetical protein